MSATTREIIEAADEVIKEARDFVNITAGFGITQVTSEFTRAASVHATRDALVGSLAILDHLNDDDETLPTPVDDAQAQEWADRILTLEKEGSELADQLQGANDALEEMERDLAIAEAQAMRLEQELIAADLLRQMTEQTHRLELEQQQAEGEARTETVPPGSSIVSDHRMLAYRHLTVAADKVLRGGPVPTLAEMQELRTAYQALLNNRLASTDVSEA